jgi:hypothetical protein
VDYATSDGEGHLRDARAPGRITLHSVTKTLIVIFIYIFLIDLCVWSEKVGLKGFKCSGVTIASLSHANNYALKYLKPC